jgi:hypothetical protein
MKVTATDHPQVRVVCHGPGNWRTEVQDEPGADWAITGPPHITKTTALLAVPEVVLYQFGTAAELEAAHRSPARRPLADTGTRYYCIRQARTKIIGSRTMTLDEAGREAAVWRDEIGPAAVIVADDAARKAVRTEDQATLAKLLEWPGPC